MDPDWVGNGLSTSNTCMENQLTSLPRKWIDLLYCIQSTL